MKSSPRSASTLIELLLVITISGIMMGLLLTAVQSVRRAAERLRCSHRMQQIGLALHSYHNTYDAFPPAMSLKADGGRFPFLSWLPRLCPFLEQSALWDETVLAFAQNPDLLQSPPHSGLNRVVPHFICPADPYTHTSQISRLGGGRFGLTNYFGVNGINHRTKDGVMYADSSTRILDITDGTSNTLFVGERPSAAGFEFGWWYGGTGLPLNYNQGYTGAADNCLGVREIHAGAYSWCRVAPYRFEPGSQADNCSSFHYWSLHSGGGYFLMADGAVRFFPYSAEPVLPALATRASGDLPSTD